MDALISQGSQPQQRDSLLSVRMGRALLGLAGATWFLMGLGSATRVMNAGLACPDWPLCYGAVIPSQQMNLEVFLEWFHRMVAAGVGLATLTLMGVAWWQRRSLPTWLPGGVSFAFGLVVLQGILGGLTVTELLRFDVVTAHLGTGLLFFATLLTLGLGLVSHTASGGPKLTQEGEALKPNPKALSFLRGMGLGAVVLVYGQSLLGALVASQWAVHRCFAYGDLCAVMNSHLLGVAPATLAVLAVAVATGILRKRIPKSLKGLGHAAVALVLAQVGIGILTYRYRLQVQPLTVAHQMTGAALLGCLVAFTVLAWQLQDRPEGEQLSPLQQKQMAVTAEITSE